MSTNYIAPIWRMPENTNKDKLSNYSINFNGSNDVINIPNSTDFDLGTAFTISGWFNFNVTSGTRGLISFDSSTTRGWFIYIYANQIRLLSGSSVFTLYTGYTTTNQWDNFIVTYDGTDLVFYINGTQESTQTVSINLQTNGLDGQIGNNQKAAGRYFNGEISQISIFDYALTDGTGGTTDQISYLYNLNNPMIPGAVNLTAPIAYWPLGDNSNPNAPGSFPNISVGTDSVFNFDGSSTWINVPDNDLLSFGGTSDSPFSMSAWIKTTAYGDGIISRWGNGSGSGSTVVGYEYILYAQRTSSTASTARLRLALYDQGTGTPTNSNVQRRDSVTIINTGEWVHVVATYDGRGNPDGISGNTANLGITMYINGVPESSYINTSGGSYSHMRNTNRPTEIGVYNDTSSVVFDGEMSNVQIWDEELSAAQALELYNNGQPLITGTQPQEANLRAWWKLNQSANWEADTVGNWQIPDNKSAYPQSFKFNETQDYIQGDLNLDGEKVHAVSFWIKNKQASGLGYVLSSRSGSYGPGFNFILRSSDNNGNIYSNVRDTPTTTQSNISGYQSALRIPQDDNWHHVIFTHDIVTNKLKAYIDGVFKYEMLPTSRTDSNTINPLKISHNASTQDFGGYVSNVMVWEDVVLTDGGVALNDVAGGEIAQVYNNGVPITSASVQPDKLKGWYKLDNTNKYLETYLNTRDNWVIENNSQNVNYNSALYMNGTSGDRVSVTSSTNLEISGSHSFSFWVFYDNYSATSYIFDKGGLDYAFQIAGVSPRIIYYGYTKSGGGTGNLAQSLPGDWSAIDNAWHHVVVTTDISAKTIRYYLDGEEQGTGFALPSDFEAVRTSTGQLTIMTYAGGTYPSRGLISNFAIYNGSVLSQPEVTALYNNGTPEATPSASPTSWWKLNNLTTGLIDNINGDNGNNTGSTVKEIPVQTTAGVSVDMTEQNLVNNNVSVLNGESVSMDTTNLVQSNLTRTQPYSNYSFHFDGTQYIDIPDSDLLSFGNGTNDSPFSISSWIKKPLNANEAIISKFGNTGTSGYEWLLWAVLSSPHRIRFAVYDNSASVYQFREGNTSIDTGEWVHVVATYDGRGGNGTIGNTANQGMKIYINGTEESSYTDGNNPSGSGYVAMHNTARNVQIGATNNSNQWDGQISNTAVFDRELTNQEVLKIYNNGVPQDLQTASSFSNNLVAWWPMDQRSSYYDGTNWVARDLENGNDGTGFNTGNVEDMVGNAPGSEANGTGSSLTIANLKDNMYDSDKNAYSVNMADYADGVTNPANSGRSTEIPTVP